MDFSFTPEEDRFRAEVGAWLAENPPERFPAEGMDGGYGSGPHSLAFMQAAGEQGWISMTWPKAYGGAEKAFFLKLILREELALVGHHTAWNKLELWAATVPPSNLSAKLRPF